MKKKIIDLHVGDKIQGKEIGINYKGELEVTYLSMYSKNTNNIILFLKGINDKKLIIKDFPKETFINVNSKYSSFRLNNF